MNKTMEDNLRSYTTRFFYETNIFPDDFIKNHKNNANETNNIPIEEKRKKMNVDGTRIICTSCHAF